MLRVVKSPLGGTVHCTAHHLYNLLVGPPAVSNKELIAQIVAMLGVFLRECRSFKGTRRRGARADPSRVMAVTLCLHHAPPPPRPSIT